MNIYRQYHDHIIATLENLALTGLIAQGLDYSRVVVEPPRDPSHGDMATNAALVLAKEAKTNPRALAELLATELAKETSITRAEVAGPGFINLTLTPDSFHKALISIAETKDAFGRSEMGKEQKLNVEYVSANPTGPMHVGHGRGAVFGDALANVLAFAGFDVTREYYINDAGAQVDVLARSAFLRYHEALGEEIGAIPEGLYPGDYLKPVGELLAQTHGKSLKSMSENEWLPLVREASIVAMMETIRMDLAAIGIAHDVFFSERSLTNGETDAIGTLINDLRTRDLVYEGTLPPPKGQIDEDWEPREQTLFRATAFGDDTDRPLLKSDGSYTYFAADIAYHASKFARGFTKMIDIWGADHGGYVTRMQAAVKAATNGQGDLQVHLCQMVRLMRAGEPVKMSKRSGEFVTLRDVIDEVGTDAIRFMMLYRKNDAMLDFDLAKVVEQSRDNPVFYVQYAHARCCSIFRQARETFGDAITAEDIKTTPPFTDDADLTLIKYMAQFPRIVEAAADAHEPHRIAFYLYELASLFHGLWNRGKDERPLRFVHMEDEALTRRRLVLVEALQTVLKNGLALLGVSAPDEMR